MEHGCMFRHMCLDIHTYTNTRTQTHTHNTGSESLTRSVAKSFSPLMVNTRMSGMALVYQRREAMAGTACKQLVTLRNGLAQEVEQVDL